MNEIIETLTELMNHYLNAGLIGEYIGIKVALDLIKGVIQCDGKQKK